MKRVLPLFFILLVTNCHVGTTARAITVLSALLDGMSLVEKSTNAYGKYVQEAVSNVESEFVQDEEANLNSKDYNISLSGLAQEWEDDWNKALDELEILEETVADLGPLANNYFGQLRQLETENTDPDMKAKERIKNDELRKQWDVIFKETNDKLLEARAIADAGKNFHRLLIAAAIRQDLTLKLDALESISTQTSALMVEFQSLIVRGKSMTQLKE